MRRTLLLNGILYGLVVAGTLCDPTFRIFSPPSLLFFLAIGITWGLAVWFEVRPPSSPSWAWGALAVQLALYYGLHLLPLPRGTLWLMAMPVISHTMFLLAWPGALVAVAAYLVMHARFYHYGPLTLGNLLQTCLAYGAACGFTVAFTHLIRQSDRAREESRLLADELAQANRQLQARAVHDAANAALRERNRIARDIHDGLGHHLTTIAVQLEAARTLFDEDPARARTAVAQAEHQSREALEEVRRSVRTLRADEPPPPLTESLTGLIRESGLDAELQVTGQPRPLPPEATQALFRVVQEGLTNIRKHARAHTARVELRYETAAIHLTVLDDGQGASGSGSGYGLAGLRERLEAIGGHLHAGNRPDGGYRLAAELPR